MRTSHRWGNETAPGRTNDVNVTERRSDARSRFGIIAKMRMQARGGAFEPSGSLEPRGLEDSPSGLHGVFERVPLFRANVTVPTAGPAPPGGARPRADPRKRGPRGIASAASW